MRLLYAWGLDVRALHQCGNCLSQTFSAVLVRLHGKSPLRYSNSTQHCDKRCVLGLASFACHRGDAWRSPADAAVGRGQPSGRACAPTVHDLKDWHTGMRFEFNVDVLIELNGSCGPRLLAANAYLHFNSRPEFGCRCFCSAGCCRQEFLPQGTA